MPQEGLLFGKPGIKKKKKKHHKSIMHNRDGTCYLCMTLEDNYRKYDHLEEHHVFLAGRKSLSEEYGLKVYLCFRHHTTLGGKESVHNNYEIIRKLQDEAQRTFDEYYHELDFIKIFGKNYKE